jgi:hypothetical protein
MTKPIVLDVGDRVKVVANPQNSELVDLHIGDVGVVTRYDEPSVYGYDIMFDVKFPDDEISFYRNELRLIKKVG